MADFKAIKISLLSPLLKIGKVGGIKIEKNVCDFLVFSRKTFSCFVKDLKRFSGDLKRKIGTSFHFFVICDFWGLARNETRICPVEREKMERY